MVVTSGVWLSVLDLALLGLAAGLCVLIQMNLTALAWRARQQAHAPPPILPSWPVWQIPSI